MHPDECAEILKAFEAKQKRERIRDASLKHVIAMAGGMKKTGGGKLTLFDFDQGLKGSNSSEEKEEAIKNYFKALAAKSKAKKEQNGQ